MPAPARSVYYGAYLRFSTADKKSGSVIAGPDTAVGDIGTIVWDLDEHQRQRAWLENPYGMRFAYLSPADSYNLAVYHAKEWTIRYVLSYTAYTDASDGPVYWGEAAVIAYDPHYAQEFEMFLKSFAERAGEGFRPNPSLSTEAVASVLENPSGYAFTSKVKMPERDEKTVIMKDHRTPHDKLLDQARGRNIGCYIISWLFIALLVAGGIWVLHLLGLF